MSTEQATHPEQTLEYPGTEQQMDQQPRDEMSDYQGSALLAGKVRTGHPRTAASGAPCAWPSPRKGPTWSPPTWTSTRTRPVPANS